MRAITSGSCSARTLTDDERGAALTPPRSICCRPAPAVMEFDAEGNFIQGWGGPGQSYPGYEWPLNEHGIYVDHKDNVWVGGNDGKDHHLLKFARDGTYVKEFFIGMQTLGSGSVWDLVRSKDPGQTWMHIVDGSNNQVWTMLRETGRVVTTFGRSGRNAGQFHWVHNVAMDSKGNLYTSEVDNGKRAQKFSHLGVR